MDPLSDVLSILKPRTYKANGFGMSETHSIQFPDHSGGEQAAIKCYAVASGSGWIEVEGLAPMPLVEGDCFLLPRGRAFRLTKDLSLPGRNYREWLDEYQGVVTGATVGTPREGEFYVVGGFFSFDSREAKMLLDTLPPVIVLSREQERAALRWSIDRLAQELSDKRPGSELVAEHLVQMMLVMALRLHVEAEAQAETKTGVGWLFAMADKQLNAATRAIHEEPQRRWTLEELAQRAGMSRSSFAQRFKQRVGRSPMEYVTRWRMLLAGDRLMHSGESVAAIAMSLGYESESAFSTAFRRVMGLSPRRYGRGKDMADIQTRQSSA